MITNKHAIASCLTALTVALIAAGVWLLNRYPNLGAYLGLACLGLVVLTVIYVFIYSIVATFMDEPTRGDWP